MLTLTSESIIQTVMWCAMSVLCVCALYLHTSIYVLYSQYNSEACGVRSQPPLHKASHPIRQSKRMPPGPTIQPSLQTHIPTTGSVNLTVGPYDVSSVANPSSLVIRDQTHNCVHKQTNEQNRIPSLTSRDGIRVPRPPPPVLPRVDNPASRNRSHFPRVAIRAQTSNYDCEQTPHVKPITAPPSQKPQRK